MHQEEQLHIPVLLEQTLAMLGPGDGDRYLDLTAGYGGHAAAVLVRTNNPSGTVLVDRDRAAIARLAERFKGRGIELRPADFLTASRALKREGRQFECILADLGVSSPHLNQTSRGFSLQKDGPLDMRMDQSQALTAEQVVNTYAEPELARIIRRYGDEPRAARIARLIADNRPIRTTLELAAIVAKAWPSRGRIHPATRTFQALRIAVNNELELLRQSLPIWLDELLAPGGRMAVISFHRLEDRLVKQAMQERAGNRYDATLRLIAKRPVTASSEELVFNPRARSAKLRAAAKQK